MLRDDVALLRSRGMGWFLVGFAALVFLICGLAVSTAAHADRLDSEDSAGRKCELWTRMAVFGAWERSENKPRAVRFVSYADLTGALPRDSMYVVGEFSEHEREFFAEAGFYGWDWADAEIKTHGTLAGVSPAAIAARFHAVCQQRRDVSAGRFVHVGSGGQAATCTLYAGREGGYMLTAKQRGASLEQLLDMGLFPPGATPEYVATIHAMVRALFRWDGPDDAWTAEAMRACMASLKPEG